MNLLQSKTIRDLDKEEERESGNPGLFLCPSVHPHLLHGYVFYIFLTSTFSGYPHLVSYEACILCVSLLYFKRSLLKRMVEQKILYLQILSIAPY